MKKLALAFSLLLLPAVAQANVRNCNAALVTAGICANATDQLVYYSLSTTDPDGAGPQRSLAVRLLDSICLVENYQSATDGTKAEFADRVLKERVLNYYMHREQDLTFVGTKPAYEQADPVPVIP